MIWSFIADDLAKYFRDLATVSTCLPILGIYLSTYSIYLSVNLSNYLSISIYLHLHNAIRAWSLIKVDIENTV